MREKYLWNPVFKKVMEIKDCYIKKYNKIDYTTNPKETNTFCKIIYELNIKEYIDWLETLKVSQNVNIFLIHYNLITAAEEMWKNSDSINREARSLVIDLENEEIVACPFKKFFNIDEIPETNLDLIINKIKGAKIFEVSDKLDGSMQQLAWYNNSYMLFGSQACKKEVSWRLEEGYNYIEKHNNYIQLVKDSPEYTFIFEFIHPDDVHVVDYTNKTPGLYLIGARNKYTGTEISYKEIIDLSKKYNILATEVEQYTLEELLNLRENFSAREKEGWVLNIDGFKIKFKTTDYIRIHKCLTSKSLTKVLIKAVADDYVDDVLSVIQECFKDKAKEIILEIFNYINKTEEEIKEWYDKAPKNNKKDFSIFVNKEVPKDLKKYVFSKYNNKEYNILKGNPGQYKTSKELNIDNFYVFEEIERNRTNQ